MHNKSILLIDDERDETAEKVSRRVDIIARNYWVGIECLKLKKWDVLLLDHDLSSFEDPKDGTTEKTGYDIMLFLEENIEYIPKKIECVSSNPVGASRIKASIKYLQKKGYL